MSKNWISCQHPILKQLMQLRMKAGQREAFKKTVAFGAEVVKYLKFSDAPVETIYIDYKNRAQYSEIANPVFVDDQFISTLCRCGQKRHQGIASRIKIPPYVDTSVLPRIIICDSVKCSGKLGRIIKAAAAMGIDGVHVLESCTDPFSPEAIEAACGAQYSLPIGRGSWEELLDLNPGRALWRLSYDLGQPMPEAAVTWVDSPLLGLVFRDRTIWNREDPALAASPFNLLSNRRTPPLDICMAAALTLSTLRGLTSTQLQLSEHNSNLDPSFP